MAYSYYGSEAYDFSLFEDKPKGKTKVKNKKTNRKVTVIPLSVKKLFCFSLVVITMLGINLAIKAKGEAIRADIASVQNEIEIAESEHVRLSSELSNKYETPEFEEYAKNKLGMILPEQHQITYIDLSEGDEIVLSGDKSKNELGFWDKFKNLFATLDA